ncbi:hypothetical protein [Streptomyces lydicus]|uniref:hypothetical protein n=1 Tax=Streptomyces lydicus TaxID=47763 RepID=UPI0037AD59F6
MVRSHMALADPVPVIGDHLLLSHLGRHGIEAFLSVLGEGSGSPLVNEHHCPLRTAGCATDPC